MGMARELIMDALNRCESYVIPECCKGCPYEGCWGTKEECITQLHADTYALLKAQEAIEPSIYHHLFICPMCKNSLFEEQKFCHECGRAVKWE